MQNAGKYIFIAGLIIALAGLIIWISGNRLNWFGRLPGDINISREGFRFYMPLTSMILISIAISLVAWIIKKL